MSSNKTENLRLHSWIGTDRVYRTEFNYNFEAIDKLFNQSSGHKHDGATNGGSTIDSININCNINGVNSSNVQEAIKEVFIEADRAILTLSNSIGNNPTDTSLTKSLEDIKYGKYDNICDALISHFKSEKTLDDYEKDSLADLSREIKNLILPGNWTGTATPKDVISGRTFINANGLQVGTLELNGTINSFNPKSEDYYIPSGTYLDSYIKDEPLLVSENIKRGVIINNVMGNFYAKGFGEGEVGYYYTDFVPNEKVKIKKRRAMAIGEDFEIINETCNKQDEKSCFAENKRYSIICETNIILGISRVYLFDKITNKNWCFDSKLLGAEYYIKHVITMQNTDVENYIFCITSNDKLIKWYLNSSPTSPYVVLEGAKILNNFNHETAISCNGFIYWETVDGDKYLCDFNTNGVISGYAYNEYMPFGFNDISYLDNYYFIVTDNGNLVRARTYATLESQEKISIETEDLFSVYATKENGQIVIYYSSPTKVFKYNYSTRRKEFTIYNRSADNRFSIIKSINDTIWVRERETQAVYSYTTGGLLIGRVYDITDEHQIGIAFFDNSQLNSVMVLSNQALNNTSILGKKYIARRLIESQRYYEVKI